MTQSVHQSVILPSGLTLSNAIVKAAMEENLAEANQLPGPALFRLYEQWAKGGAGLLITGNVMIDRLAMTGPSGVALEAGTELAPFQHWVSRVHTNGAKVVMQINHPGRQVFARMGGRAWSASDVPLNMGKHSKLFAQPRTMDESQIQEVIERFAVTARRAEQAGFNGVQIHAAHGYLLAQFLSPLTNRRQDKWGGSLSNRARLLLEVVKAVNTSVSDSFSVSVKLNSADFQRGGFDVQDAQSVVAMLNAHQLDFVELSGGSYEAPAMQGRSGDQRTLAREAFFLEFAEQMLEVATMPLMTTGGITRLATANRVINKGVRLVGIASALAQTPDLPRRWQQGEFARPVPKATFTDKTLAGLATMAMVRRQLRRMSAGKLPKRAPQALLSLIQDQWRLARLTRRYRAQIKRSMSELAE